MKNFNLGIADELVVYCSYCLRKNINIHQ